MRDNVEVTIDYTKIAEDSRWDGLKGYLTNTTIPAEQVYTACHNLFDISLQFIRLKPKGEIFLFKSAQNDRFYKN